MSDPQQQDLGAGALLAGDVTAVIVGGGWRGLSMLHRLRGLGLSARVYLEGSEETRPERSRP